MNYRQYLRRSLEPIDRLLDGITSYRLILYSLYIIVGWAVIAAALNQLFFKWYLVALSAAWLIAICWSAGYLLSRFMSIARNRESDYITALILALILAPAADLKGLLILTGAGVAAVTSKYILTLGKRHIFNPAAFGAFFAGLTFHHHASWWVGTSVLMPLVLIGGLLILRKMKRFTLVGVFLTIYLIILAFDVLNHQSSSYIGHNLWLALSASPLLFFSTIMLTEPSTSPHSLNKYTPYGLLVAVLYAITSLHISPEEALLIGNVLAFALAPAPRLVMKFAVKHKEAEGIYSFRFKPAKPLKFQPGQYMEWTLPGTRGDSRGNRRYFTISSAPTESGAMVTVRLPSPSSSYKTQLDHLELGEPILASQLAGDFTLPKNQEQKLAFIAGGVGITPFRSMAKHLLDTRENRDITLLYAAAKSSEFAFRDLFSRAKTFGLRTFYVATEQEGAINAKKIKSHIPDWQQRYFYISGPYGFVSALREVLLKMGVKNNQILADYFPGYG